MDCTDSVVNFNTKCVPGSFGINNHTGLNDEKAVTKKIKVNNKGK